MINRTSVNMPQWMEMGKKSRLKFDQDYKIKVMHRKKQLINQIRGEYIKLKKSQ